MNPAWVDVILWLLASPVLFLRAIARTLNQGKVLAAAVRAAIRCECGETVSLLGLWRCECGFTYKGHLVRECPVCRTIPAMVRCYACGVTTKLPLAAR